MHKKKPTERKGLYRLFCEFMCLLVAKKTDVSARYKWSCLIRIPYIPRLIKMMPSKFLNQSSKVRLLAATFFWAPCTYLWLSMLLLFFPTIGTADVVFDLLDDSAIYSVLDDQPSGLVTNGGILATLTASEGVLNRTQDGFGINDPYTDDTDALDVGEYIDISFDQAVSFRNVNVSSWNKDFDFGDILLGNGGMYVSQGNILGTGDTGFNFVVSIGQVVRIKSVAGESATNGFSFDSFSVEAIPEPAVISFITLIGIGGIMARRLFE
ncbi:hypothetical protein P4B35_15370 [Pontiellaceae bacterium B12227]|nr:hypothetical protein [Pontiellaceae bacterium B12227]